MGTDGRRSGVCVDRFHNPRVCCMAVRHTLLLRLQRRGQISSNLKDQGLDVCLTATGAVFHWSHVQLLAKGTVERPNGAKTHILGDI